MNSEEIVMKNKKQGNDLQWQVIATVREKVLKV